MNNPMDVSIVQEWALPKEDETFTKSNPANSLFYLVKLQKGRVRYLKVGTTARTIQERFADKGYKAYSFIKFLYVAEVTCDKQPEIACNQVEDLTRCAFRKMKGFTFVKNDRFKYFQLPAQLPVYTDFDKSRLVSTR